MTPSLYLQLLDSMQEDLCKLKQALTLREVEHHEEMQRYKYEQTQKPYYLTIEWYDNQGTRLFQKMVELPAQGHLDIDTIVKYEAGCFGLNQQATMVRVYFG